MGEALKQYLASLTPTFAGKLLFYLLPYRKKVVLANMQQVFGSQLSKQEIIHLAKCFYSHLATSIKENLQMRFMSEAAITRRAQVVGHETVIRLNEQYQKGVMILTGHFGNWEFSPIAGIMSFKQFQGRFYFIRKTLRFKFLEQLLFRRYYQAGLHVIPKQNSLNQVCDVLEQNHVVVFVMDQHANPHNRDGVVVDFFGKKAGTYRSLATIARYTGTPVVPATSYRKPDGTHVLEFFDPIPFVESDDSKQALLENTRRYNQALEQILLLHPEQWLWTHKRWKV